MRRIFILVLVALLLGVGVVAVIETDPGYVLVAYGSYTVETSLWVGILLLTLFTLAIYGVIRLVRRLLGKNNSLTSWLGSRRSRAAARLTTRGLISFIEGNWSRARRQLLRGARNNDAPMINYLMAARSSYRLNDADKMHEYLGAAEDAESEAGIAVELTQAELKLHAGAYEQALATLVRARRNAGRHPHVLDLLHRAYYGLEDWEELAALLPELKKYKVLSPKQLEELDREVCTQSLAASVTRGNGDPADSLQQAWQKMPAPMKQDPELVYSYVQLLADNSGSEAAEKVILRNLKQSWDSRLVRLYGLLENDNAAKRLAQAESWLPEHSQDAQLLISLGRMCAKEKLWGKARDYFESAYRLEHTSEICAELGRLINALGEPKVAAAYYREGLTLSESDLPELPLPENVTPQSRRLANS